MGIFGNILNEYELNTKPSFNENIDTESQILRARGQNAKLPIYTPQQAEAVVNSEQARRDYIQQPQQTQQQGEFTAPPPPNIPQAPQAPQAPSTDNLNQGNHKGGGFLI
ncbi:MAG: hypothetical protein IJ923_03185 [Campylobacter sp.]|nr:hypothetical protein [Campylobacter sp.]